MKRVNIGLKDNIHSKAKIISILKNVSLSQYIESCIEKKITDDQQVLEKLNS